jgi:hypothetical protein
VRQIEHQIWRSQLLLAAADDNWSVNTTYRLRTTCGLQTVVLARYITIVVLRRIFGPNKEEVPGDWRKALNEERVT